MRIALLSSGLTGYLVGQYRALSDLGNELLVVSPGGSPDTATAAMPDTSFEALGTEQFAKVLYWDEFPKHAALTERVLAFQPDAVFMTSWNGSSAYRAVMRRVPSSTVRIIVMDNLWRGAPKQWLGRAVHRVYVDPVADAVMVPSYPTEFYARRLGFGAADVIRGSLTADVSIFNSQPRTAEELSSRRRFLYAGRLVNHKGADVLAAAYARYRQRVENPWDLDVVGLGPLARLLEGQPGVTMHGFLQAPDLARLMREVSCSVVPSVIEPFGVVVHEAAASGLPLLCADFAGAMPAFVQDGYNGWVVPSGDAELLAAAMARMTSLDGARLAEMSEVSLALATRLSPQGWARNLHEELERRIAAGGGRLSKR